MNAPFRMTPQTRQLISYLLMDSEGDHYGFEILKATGLKPGTLYPTLARFEEAGWITGTWERIDPETARRPARRYYRLTADGVAAGISVEAEAAAITKIAGSAPLTP